MRTSPSGQIFPASQSGFGDLRLSFHQVEKLLTPAMGLARLPSPSQCAKPSAVQLQILYGVFAPTTRTV